MKYPFSRLGKKIQVEIWQISPKKYTAWNVHRIEMSPKGPIKNNDYFLLAHAGATK